MKKNKNSVSKWKKKCWTIFSQYIRLKDATPQGMVKCVTCDKIDYWKNMQAGHFVPGRGNAYLFDERGVHPQCRQCNLFKNGNWVPYLQFMEDNYNTDVIKELMTAKNETKKFTVDELQNLYLKYEKKVIMLSWKE